MGAEVAYVADPTGRQGKAKKRGSAVEGDKAFAGEATASGVEARAQNAETMVPDDDTEIADLRLMGLG